MATFNSVESFVEKALDQISSFGEIFGLKIGKASRTTVKLVIAAGILLLFGAAIFIWGMAKGVSKKDRK